MNKADALYEKLGDKIASLRKEKGLSQEQLSAKSGIDRSHIGFIEQGRRKPTLSTLVSITTALGISLEELFEGLEQ